VSDQRQAFFVGLVDLDVELQPAPGERVADTGGRTPDKPRAVEIEQLERDRRPAGDGVGLGKQLERK
jgi:hypothetical protein